LNSRLECIRRLKRKGWRVRLCIDPMIAVSNWREVYQDFATRIHEKLADSPPDEISIGVFRVNWEFLQNMRKRRSTSALLHYPYAQRAGVGSYAPELEDEMKSFFRQQLVTLIPEDRIFI
jgi:spore photoproduct lyase